MRKIGFSQILVFVVLLSIAVVLGVGTVMLAVGELPLGDFRGVTLVVASLIAGFVYAIVVYRAYLVVCPLNPGEIPEGSSQEFVYHVYLLFYLLVFYPVMRSGAVPVPFMRLVYQALGARLGRNTYSSGIILDPKFVSMGDNCIVGQFALLVPHVIEGRRLAHNPIRIGNNVTIGAHAVVLSDVRIGDDAIVATGAVVPKGTEIGRGETWGGVPARLLQRGDTGR